jgi:hypothetical protein
MENREPDKTQVGFKKPLIIFALPFICFLPTLWLFTVVIPGQAHAPEQFGGVEHLRRHWGAFFVVFYFAFTVICFLWALIVLLFRLRQRR